MDYLLLVIAAIFCAYQVVRSQRLLNVSLWLAVTSAVVALIIYMLGAPEVAVIELSVGAGLVTVLFVFAFSIVGELTVDMTTLLPRAQVWALVLMVSFALGWLVMPLAVEKVPASELSFASTLWRERGLDVIAQIVLIFCGVMGLIGLLSSRKGRI
jgi:uncharacterized MnhB-related membrane protein